MANMKKSVFSVNMECDKCKKDALQCIARVEEVDMVKIDLEKKTITVEGEADPASITNQLRVKFKSARLVSTGPLPPPQKKDDDKKKPTQVDKSQEKPKNEKGSTQQAGANGAKKKQKDKENPGDSKEKEQTTQKDGTKDDKQSKEKPKQKETTNKPKKVENPPKQHDEQQIRFFPSYPPCVVHYPCPPVSHCRCSDCSCRSDMLWPRYQPPNPRTEIWYVMNEETPSSCTIS